LGAGDRNLVALTRDGNGLWNLFGANNGLNLREVTTNKGETAAAGTFYTVTFGGNETTYAYFVDSTIVPALIS
jgi:hypothetical protein